MTTVFLILSMIINVFLLVMCVKTNDENKSLFQTLRGYDVEYSATVGDAEIEITRRPDRWTIFFRCNLPPEMVEEREEDLIEAMIDSDDDVRRWTVQFCRTQGVTVNKKGKPVKDRGQNLPKRSIKAGWWEYLAYAY